MIGDYGALSSFNGKEQIVVRYGAQAFIPRVVFGVEMGVNCIVFPQYFSDLFFYKFLYALKVAFGHFIEIHVLNIFFQRAKLWAILAGNRVCTTLAKGRRGVG